MVVTKKEQTADEMEREQREIEIKKKDAVNAVLTTLDLPTEDKVKEEQERARQEELLKRKDEELSEEEKAEKATLVKKIEEKDEDITPENFLKIPDEQLTEEGIKVKRELEKELGEEEELIPKSKVKKRFAQFTEKINKLEREAERRAAREGKDPDMVRLEGYTLEQLRSTKRTVRRKQISETDEDKIEALLDLEMKIDECISNLPERFRQKQIDRYNEAAIEIENDPEIGDLTEASPQIMEIANEIYMRYPRLQKLEEGQAMALQFAAEHYKQLTKLSVGKSREKKLKRFTTKLKRKTALDTNLLKVSKDKVNLQRLREKAGRGSTLLEKQALVRHDPRFGIDQLVPDKFKGG